MRIYKLTKTAIIFGEEYNLQEIRLSSMGILGFANLVILFIPVISRYEATIPLWISASIYFSSIISLALYGCYHKIEVEPEKENKLSNEKAFNNPNSDYEVYKLSNPLLINGKGIGLFLGYLLTTYAAYFSMVPISSTITKIFLLINFIVVMWVLINSLMLFLGNKINMKDQYLISIALFLYTIYPANRDSYKLHFGIKKLGSYLQKNDFDANYLVKAKNLTQDNDHYRYLESKIRVTQRRFEESNGDGESETYVLTYIQFLEILDENKNVIKFKNCETEYRPKNTYCICEDLLGNEWEITLTDTKIE